MTEFVKPVLAGIFGGLLAGPSMADEKSGPVFQEPSVLKVGWEAQALFVGDIDNDGVADLAVADDSKARISLRYGLKKGEKLTPQERSMREDKWDPVLEDSPYQKDFQATGVGVYDLHFVDLNGDGLLDMVYTTDRDALVMVPQTQARKWGEPQEKELQALHNNWTTLTSGDLDGDGDPDLAVLGETTLAVVRQEKGQLLTPDFHPVGESCYGLQAVEVTGDGKVDLVYQDSELERVLLRPQRAGRFPLEQMLQTGAPESVVQFTPEKSPRLFNIEEETRVLQGYRFLAEEVTLKDREPPMLSYPVPKADGEDVTFAWADLEGDGDLDLVVANEEGVFLKLFRMGADGQLEELAQSATVAGISALAVGDLVPGGGREILVHSPEEGLLGISTLNEDGSLSFPKQIALEGTVEAVAVAQLDLANPREDIVILQKDSLLLLSDSGGKWKQTKVELDGVGNGSPSGLFPCDLNQDGRTDFLVLERRDSAKILVQQEKETLFREVELKDSFEQQLLKRVGAASLSQGDFDGDGTAEVLVCGAQYARALRLTEDDRLEVVGQVGPQVLEGRLAACALRDVLEGPEGEKAAVEAIFYDAKNDELLITDLKGTPLKSVEVPATGFSRLLVTDRDILVAGDGQVVRLPLGQKLLSTHEVVSFQTDLRDMEYGDFRLADLNGDGHSDAVVADPTNSHGLEILLGKAEGGFESHQHFVIYRADRHYRGKRGASYQPRDLQLHDVNDDGKVDLILHIHDRILIYLQN